MHTYVFKGVVYHGPADLQAETGIPIRTARWHMKKHGHLRHLEGRYNDGGSASYLNPAHPITIEGVEFSSLRDASRKTGISQETIRRWHVTTQTIYQAVKAYKKGQENVE